ncbi:hypothetical protein [Halomonas sp. HAL1]|uniref:hypothetical protein n=1 Tax=Halomonas sp. HAL1 TaxID=550984 RepID=UPI001EE689FD|nr:hypothetical protein [Halomonas sp. HAL1]WKV94265.1 hypothetical protein Q3Y66_06490 [Halomonas sp. HAL1]
MENVLRGGGEMLYGLVGSYALCDQLTMRMGAETQDNSTTYGEEFDTLALGITYTTGPWAFTADYHYYEVLPRRE